jgi:hypothetical protein
LTLWWVKILMRKGRPGDEWWWALGYLADPPIREGLRGYSLDRRGWSVPAMPEAGGKWSEDEARELATKYGRDRSWLGEYPVLWRPGMRADNTKLRYPVLRFDSVQEAHDLAYLARYDRRDVSL